MPVALVQPPSHELNPPSTNEISTDNAEQFSLLERPEKEQLHQLPPPRRDICLITAKIAVVLIFTIAYLTFCFIVRYHNIRVPFGGSGDLDLPFYSVKVVSVITTLAILIVNISLFPMKGVIDEIRTEEFFRLMHIHPNGLPLDKVNAVSATTTGSFDIFMATIHRHCSPLLSSTIFISILITATTSIAPAALSAGLISIEVDNSTFGIGALPKGSVLTDLGATPGVHDVATMSMGVINLLPLASTMAYIENTLNLTNSYYKVTSSEGDQFEYLVPFPSGYTSIMKAHWTTDVIVLNPSCSWQTATTTGPVNSTWEVALLESNLSVILHNYSFVSAPATSMVSVILGSNLSSEFPTPLDGSVLFVIDQLNSYNESTTDSAHIGGYEFNPGHTVPVNLSSIPTLKFPSGDVLAFLLCSPHVSIQTRQVLATGNGNLTLGNPQPSQGNIDSIQANYLLSNVLTELPQNSGPVTYFNQLGTDLIVKFFFGDNQSRFLPQVYEHAPLDNITVMYKQLIQSAMKPFLSGGIASANVSGGYFQEQMVFTSSLGHVITSAILFALLTISLVATQLRKQQVAFTFVYVAAALADSDVPEKCEEITQFKAGMGERKVLRLVPGGDGQLNCAYQSIQVDKD